MINTKKAMTFGTGKYQSSLITLYAFMNFDDLLMN